MNNFFAKFGFVHTFTRIRIKYSTPNTMKIWLVSTQLKKGDIDLVDWGLPERRALLLRGILIVESFVNNEYHGLFEKLTNWVW